MSDLAGKPTPSSLTLITNDAPPVVSARTAISPVRPPGNACLKEFEINSFKIKPHSIAVWGPIGGNSTSNVTRTFEYEVSNTPIRLSTSCLV